MVCNGGNACVAPPLGKFSFDNDANLGMVSAPATGLGSGTMRAGSALNSPPVVPASRPAGVRGQGLSFDGINQHVTFPASTALDNIATKQQYTVAAWVRVPAVKTGDTWIISRHDAASGSTYQVFGLGLISGTPMVTTFHVTPLAAGPIAVNTWTHLAGTYDGNTLTLFVNGCLANRSDVGVTLVPQQTALILGAKQDGQSTRDFFQGDIDDVILLDRALSQLQVQQLMYAPSSCR